MAGMGDIATTHNSSNVMCCELRVTLSSRRDMTHPVQSSRGGKSLSEEAICETIPNSYLPVSMASYSNDCPSKMGSFVCW